MSTVKQTPFTEWISNSKRVCAECEREFDLMIHEDQADWHYGHDCEA